MGVDDTLSFCLFFCLFILLHCILKADIFNKKEDSTNSRRCIEKIPFNLIGKSTMFFFVVVLFFCFVFVFVFLFFFLFFFFDRAIMARTQICVHRWRAQNRDFGAFSWTDLTRV